jgi:hypothetical protein
VLSRAIKQVLPAVPTADTIATAVKKILPAGPTAEDIGKAIKLPLASFNFNLPRQVTKDVAIKVGELLSTRVIAGWGTRNLDNVNEVNADDLEQAINDLLAKETDPAPLIDIAQALLVQRFLDGYTNKALLNWNQEHFPPRSDWGGQTRLRRRRRQATGLTGIMFRLTVQLLGDGYHRKQLYPDYLRHLDNCEVVVVAAPASGINLHPVDRYFRKFVEVVKDKVCVAKRLLSYPGKTLEGSSNWHRASSNNDGHDGNVDL